MTLSYNVLDHIKGDQNKTNFIHKTDTMLLHKFKQKHTVLTHIHLLISHGTGYHAH